MGAVLRGWIRVGVRCENTDLPYLPGIVYSAVCPWSYVPYLSPGRPGVALFVRIDRVYRVQIMVVPVIVVGGKLVVFPAPGLKR